MAREVPRDAFGSADRNAIRIAKRQSDKFDGQVDGDKEKYLAESSDKTNHSPLGRFHE